MATTDKIIKPAQERKLIVQYRNIFKQVRTTELIQLLSKLKNIDFNNLHPDYSKSTSQEFKETIMLKIALLEQIIENRKHAGITLTK